MSAMRMSFFARFLRGVRRIVNSHRVSCLVVGRVRPSRDKSVTLVGGCCPGVGVINGGGALKVLRNFCNMASSIMRIGGNRALSLKGRRLDFILVPVIR